MASNILNLSEAEVAQDSSHLGIQMNCVLFQDVKTKEAVEEVLKKFVDVKYDDKVVDRTDDELKAIMKKRMAVLAQGEAILKHVPSDVFIQSNYHDVLLDNANYNPRAYLYARGKLSSHARRVLADSDVVQHLFYNVASFGMKNSDVVDALNSIADRERSRSDISSEVFLFLAEKARELYAQFGDLVA